MDAKDGNEINSICFELMAVVVVAVGKCKGVVLMWNVASE